MAWAHGKNICEPDTKGSVRGEDDRKITQRTRWDQVVEKDLENAGVSLAEARGLEADCQEWKKVVSASY